jgi:hypothetical protein
MPSSYVSIRYSGKIYKIRKSPYETDEKAYDRAWYIAKLNDDSMSLIEKESRSHMWANEKYYGMTYV